MVLEKKKKLIILACCGLFVLYTVIAARPVPVETILVKNWLSSLESDYPIQLQGKAGETASGYPVPFELGTRFGYIGADGRFLINKNKRNYVSMSPERWSEYGRIPRSIEIRNPADELLQTIEDPSGYPQFLDGRVFLVGKERTSISAFDENSKMLWNHDYGSTLTCLDAAAGFVLSGSLDGAVEFVDSSGNLVFPVYYPGGSRVSVIAGCALSRDASRFAIISGIDDQRFLLLERFEESYKVIYHEFLTDGFRRPVHISFIDNDGKIAFERKEGLGIYDIKLRKSYTIPLDGEIIDIDDTGNERLLFLITGQSETAKRLVVIRLPYTIIMEAPFKSGTEFLGRDGRRLYVGGGTAVSSFNIERK
ncbi:MAG: WD40 repeat domain-containing protein [Treponema sp.]|jgi:hypothetical protein|nr:WD40 repeat domain-containing protein [Treponema sp.]